MSVYQWSTTPANNATADPVINWREGQSPSTVNNSARNEMAEIAKFRKDTSGELVTTGTGSAYAVTTNSTFSLVDGIRISVRFHADCGADPTLNVNAGGALPMKMGRDTDIAESDIAEGDVFDLVYQHAVTSWVLLGAVATRFQFYDGAEVRTIQGKMRDYFNGADVGMAADDTTDNAEFFDEISEEIGNALPSRIRVDLPSGGVIKTTSGLVLSDKFVSVVGGGPGATSILYSGSDKLFDLKRSSAENALYSFADFMVDTDQAGGVTAWYVEQDSESGVVGGTDILRIRNVLGESQGSGYWQHGLWTKNVGGIYTSDFSFINDNDLTAENDTDTSAIFIDNDNALIFVIRAFHSHNCYFQRFNKGIRVNAQNSVESIYVSQGEIIARTGAYFDGAAGANRVGAFTFDGVHMDTVLRGVHGAAECVRGRVTNCEIIAGAHGGTAQEWYAVDFETGGEQVTVALNTISGNASANSNPVTAVRFGGTFFRGSVGPNQVKNCDVGYAIEDTANNCEIIPGSKFADVTTPYSITTSGTATVNKGLAETLGSLEGQFTGDLDALAGNTQGMYWRRLGGGSSNRPSGSDAAGSMVQTMVWDANSAKQLFFNATNNNQWVRTKTGGSWGSWATF